MEKREIANETIRLDNIIIGTFRNILTSGIVVRTILKKENASDVIKNALGLEYFNQVNLLLLYVLEHGSPDDKFEAGKILLIARKIYDKDAATLFKKNSKIYNLEKDSIVSDIDYAYTEEESLIYSDLKFKD